MIHEDAGRQIEGSDSLANGFANEPVGQTAAPGGRALKSEDTSAAPESVREFLPNPDASVNGHVPHRTAGPYSGLVAQSHIVPLPRQRWVLLHYHIFNNAGVTIDYLLERSFGSSLAMVHGPEPDSALHAADVASFVAAHGEISAVSSHHLRYPKPVIPEVVVCDLCFLRDPLERLWSTYKYLRGSQPTDDLGRFSKSRNAQAFFIELIEKHPQTVNDVQVNLLANKGEYTRPLANSDLRAALDVLGQISILGVVDLFDESALAAEYFIRPAFPTFQFQYVRQSVEVVNGRQLRQRLDAFRAAIGNEVYDELARLNELDTELVACARKEVLRRWEMLPSRDARVADFRERCRILQAVHDAMTLTPGLSEVSTPGA